MVVSVLRIIREETKKETVGQQQVRDLIEDATGTR